jgi:hypothetical protein
VNYWRQKIGMNLRRTGALSLEKTFNAADLGRKETNFQYLKWGTIGKVLPWGELEAKKLVYYIFLRLHFARIKTRFAFIIDPVHTFRNLRLKNKPNKKQA